MRHLLDKLERDHILTRAEFATLIKTVPRNWRRTYSTWRGQCGISITARMFTSVA